LSDSEIFDADFETLSEEQRDAIAARLTKTLLRWSKVRGDEAFLLLHANDIAESKTLEAESK
jgi:hypothetical protein